MANYSFKNGVDLPAIPPDKIFKESNFYQLEPNTSIFPGITDLTFIRCNLTNCQIPPDATKISCRHVQVGFCTNLRPDLVDHGLSECIPECSHMTNKEEIWIDSTLVDTIYEYEDTQVI